MFTGIGIIGDSELLNGIGIIGDSELLVLVLVLNGINGFPDTGPDEVPESVGKMWKNEDGVAQHPIASFSDSQQYSESTSLPREPSHWETPTGPDLKLVDAKEVPFSPCTSHSIRLQ